MDKIFIRDLALRCIIGVYRDERIEKQDVIINIVLECDHSAAAKSDRLDDAVDYKTIKKRVIEMVEISNFQLIETLADRIAQICLDDARIQSVTVTVDKPNALRFARSVAVEITRDRTANSGRGL